MRTKDNYLDIPIRQPEAARRKTAVVSARLPWPDDYNRTRTRAAALGFTSVGEYIKSLIYKDIGETDDKGS